MSQSSKHSVLLVEDNERIADMYQKWLSKKFDADVVYSAEEAMNIFNRDYDLVLLDRDLPEKNGDEILPVLRAENEDCVYTMLTATDPSEALSTLKCDDYIRKPVPEEKLLSTAKLLIKRLEYPDELREYLSLGRRVEVLEDKFPESRLEQNEEYDNMVNRLAELHSELQSEIQKLDRRELPNIEL